MVLKNLKKKKLTLDHHSQDFLTCFPRYENELNHGVTAIIKVQDEDHTF